MCGFVIGLGTGRCGTKSLAKFLNDHGVKTTHEAAKLVWEPDEKQWGKVLANFGSDVGFYWLNYIELVLESYPDTKFICLKRDKERVVASYMRRLACPFTCTASWIKQTGLEEVTYYRDTVTQKDLDNMDSNVREVVLADWDKPYSLRPIYLEKYFPTYPLGDKETCLNLFWDDYYIKADKWEDKYPDSFMIIDMHEALNTEEGNNKILNFIGICPNGR